MKTKRGRLRETKGRLRLGYELGERNAKTKGRLRLGYELGERNAKTKGRRLGDHTIRTFIKVLECLIKSSL
jgi:hypothetical protein